MKRESDLAKGWMLKGDSDLTNAKRTVASDGPYDTACFHAQQAVDVADQVRLFTIEAVDHKNT